jgi:ParB-like chromosome segregation protein Spo0J
MSKADIQSYRSESGDLAALEVALIESMVHKDQAPVSLNPVEEARVCSRLVSELGLSYQQIGDRVGCHKARVANLMRLLQLSDEVLELMACGELSEAHGRALLLAKDPEARRQLAREAIKRGWSTRMLQARARESNTDVAKSLRYPEEQEPDPAQGPDVAAQQVLQRAGTIAWATALGAITVEALAERDQLPTVAAQERLDEAVGLGLMEQHSVLVGYPSLYTATVAGRRLARKHEEAGGYRYPKGLRTARVTIKDARHAIACAGVAAALERRYPGHRVIGERELHRDERERGRRLASVDVFRYGQRRSHFPDIVIWPPSAAGEAEVPLPVAVEVELTLKSREELTAICRAWNRARHIEAVLYLAETRKLEERLLDTIEQVEAEDMIVVNPLSAILKPLPGFPLDDR